jgi:hypothetical protein
VLPGVLGDVHDNTYLGDTERLRTDRRQRAAERFVLRWATAGAYVGGDDRRGPEPAFRTG